MSCLNVFFLEQLLIWVVVVAAVVAIVRLLIPHIVGPLGALGVTVTQALYIIIWAIVAIAVIVVIFDLLGCVVGFPRLRG